MVIAYVFLLYRLLPAQEARGQTGHSCSACPHGWVAAMILSASCCRQYFRQRSEVETLMGILPSAACPQA